MPRFARNNKRPVKWCRTLIDETVQDRGNLVVGDVHPLCPITTAVDGQEDITVSNIRIAGAVTRSSNLAVAETVLAWIVLKQKFNFTTGAAIQVINPFTINVLARQDIMGLGYLSVPPVVINGFDGVDELSGESIAFDINIKAQRKLNRNTDGIAIWFASATSTGGDGIVSVRCTTSMLMKFH